MVGKIRSKISAATSIQFEFGSTGTALSSPWFTAFAVTACFAIGSSGALAADVLNTTAAQVLTVANGTSVDAGGIIDNQGEILMRGTSALTKIQLLSAESPATLTGGGTVSLTGYTNNYNRIYGYGGTLINQDNLIVGSGYIGGSLVLQNAGVVQASGSAGLTVQVQSGSTNTGYMQASSGGYLALNGSFIDNATGTIQALTGSTVRVNSGQVTGGSFRAVGSGVLSVGGTISGAAISAQNSARVELTGGGLLTGTSLSTSGAATWAASGGNRLDNVTIGVGVQLDAQNGSNTYLSGGILNQGRIALNTAGSETALRVHSTYGPTTLSGGGRIILADNALSRIYGHNGTLINQGNQIQGAGFIGGNSASETLTLNNAGTVTANGTNALNIQAQLGSTNTNIMQAVSGSTLRLIDSNFDNAGGTIRASVGSRVEVANSIIRNGSLQAQDGAQIVLSNGNLAGTSLSTLGTGAYSVAGTNNVLWNMTVGSNTQLDVNNGSLALLGGNIENRGEIAVNSLGASTRLRVNPGYGTAVLSGGGTITLGNNPANQIYGENGTLINQDNLIQGAGIIGGSLTLNNAGVIDANQSNRLSVYARSGSTNTGILQASLGGRLELNGSFIDNTAGTIQALTGSTVLFNSGQITGGSFKAAGSGLLSVGGTISGAAISAQDSARVELTGGGTLTGTSLSTLGTATWAASGDNRLGNVTIGVGVQLNARNGSNTYLSGGIINQGEIALNTAGNETALRVYSAYGPATLSGGGTIVMADSTLSRIYGHNSTLTNQDNLIQGAGYIGGYGSETLILKNAGRIQAGSNAGLTVSVANGSTNTGLIQAGIGKTLRFNNSVIDNTSGTIRALLNSTIDINGGQITGGDLVAYAGSARVDLSNGSLINTTLSTTGSGTFSASGNNLLQNVTVGSNTLLDVKNGSYNLLAGNTVNRGEIALNSLGVTTRLRINPTYGPTTLSGGGTITLGNNTANQIYGENGTLINQDNLIQGTGYIGGSLTLNNAGTVSANGTSDLRVLVRSGSTNTGTLQASNGARLNLSGSYFDNTGGTIRALNGSTVVTSGAGNLANVVGSTLNGGTYQVVSTGDTSTLNISGAAITTNNANVTLDGVNTVFSQIDGLADNQGRFSVLGGRSFATTAGLTNSGTVAVGSGSDISVNGSYTQTAGELVLGGGGITAADLDILGGTVSGNGTIYGNLNVSGGTVGPGFSPGAITVDGDFSLDPFSILTMEIGGTDPLLYDQLFVTGTADLLGTIEISFINEFLPTAGNLFTIISAGVFTDLSTLVSLSVVGGPEGLQFETIFGDGTLSIGSFQVSAVPLPGSLVMFLSGLAGIAFLRRRRTSRGGWDSDGAESQTQQMKMKEAA